MGDPVAHDQPRNPARNYEWMSASNEKTMQDLLGQNLKN